MKRILLAATSVFAIASAAQAAVVVADLDTDGDKMASFAEVVVVAPSLSQTEFNEIDINDNNQWDFDEISMGNAQGYLQRSMTEQSMTVDMMALDKDGDEKASLAEVNAVAPSVTDLEFKEVDANKDNFWDASELTGTAQGLMRRGMAGVVSSGPFVIQALDTNADGTVSMEEAVAVNASISEDEFRTVDVNRSNSWDNDELNGEMAQGFLSRR